MIYHLTTSGAVSFGRSLLEHCWESCSHPLLEYYTTVDFPFASFLELFLSLLRSVQDNPKSDARQVLVRRPQFLAFELREQHPPLQALFHVD